MEVSAAKNAPRHKWKALFDGGATTSLINYQQFKMLGDAWSVRMNTVLKVAGGEHQGSLRQTAVYLWMSQEKYVILHALVIRGLDIFIPVCQEVYKLFPSIKKEDFALDYSTSNRLGVILGQDILWTIASIKGIKSRIVNTATAFRSPWGWIAQGQLYQINNEEVERWLEKKNSHPTVMHVAMALEADRILDAQRRGKRHRSLEKSVDQEKKTLETLAKHLEDFMSLETLGISPLQDSQLRPEELRALEMFKANLTYNESEKRYTSKLLFKDDAPPLIQNRGQAYTRLLSTESKLKKNPVFKEKYIEGMRQYFERGDAEWVSENELELTLESSYFLPHSGVLKESSVTTKLRIVFDGSSKTRSGYSLNECLMTGPQFEPDLLKLLLRFRMHIVAICGDISKMYLAINLRKEDRKYLRFLWREDPTLPAKVAQMTRVTFGIADSSFQSTETVKVHAKKYEDKYPDAVKKVLDDRWVDDLVTGEVSADKAIKMIQDVQNFMSLGSFHFRKWMSNSPEVMNMIPAEDRADLDNPINFNSKHDEGIVTKVLGVTWNPKSDVMKPIAALEVKDGPPTRTTVASGMAQIFDPLGMASPFTITAKILHQDVWKDVKLPKHPTTAERKAAWRCPLAGEEKERWIEWEEQVPKLAALEIPRCYIISGDSLKREVHVFGDASPKAFAAVSYMVTEYPSGARESRFIVAKCRVNPARNPHTLARLELMASLAAARMLDHFRTSTDLQEKATLWTDSGIAYFWIGKSPKSCLEWVSKRVEEIQKLTTGDEWRHLPGLENPADLATRGISAEELISSKFWLQGPSWLTLPRTSWPTNVFNEEELIGKNLEMKSPKSKKKLEKEVDAGKKVVQFARSLALDHLGNIMAMACQCKKDCDMTEFHDQIISKFSSFVKMVRVTAYCLRFVRRSPQDSVYVMPLEFEKVLLFWVGYLQKLRFPEEIKLLKQKKTVTTGRLAKVSPFLGRDGLLRVGGRLQEAPTSDFDERHPMILPHDHIVVKRIIRWIHNKAFHEGPEWTYYHLRRRFWLPKARRTIKAALAGCVTCKRWHARSIAQKISPLPEDRLVQSRPFSRIGVDFAGPFLATEEATEVTKVDAVELRRTIEVSRKVWICLFTCMSTRAVCVDVVTDMKTSTFLNALRRLAARFGKPEKIWSDNAKTFKAAANELKALWSPSSFKKMKAKLLEDGITWINIAPASPWQGGFYERLVGLVKAPFKKVFLTQKMSLDEFRTVMLEIEAVVNSRPLAAVTDDPSDPTPVTPAKLLFGYEASQLPASVNLKMQPSTPAGRWKLRLKVRDEYTKLFKNQYILDLIASSKSDVPVVPVEIGEMVLIHVDNCQRSEWPIGVITDASPGLDGVVRTVTVKTAAGYFRRGVQRIVRLQFKANQPLDLDAPSSVNVEDEV